MTSKDAVILLNLGGPDSQEAVAPYIRNLFADPEMIKLPLGPRGRRIFAGLVAKMRGRSSRHKYELIGGSSPLNRITVEQAAALGAELSRRGLEVLVEVGMRYWRPTIDEALKNCRNAGASRVVSLPLYPQYSRVTTGSSVTELERHLRGDVQMVPVDQYPVHPGYVAAVRQTVEDALAKLDERLRSEAVVLFSAHSIPLKTVQAGDPYPDQIRATVAAVMDGLEGVRHALAFQSKVGPVAWLGPDTDDELGRLAGEGIKAIVAVPLGFVSDHLETLYDLDIKLARVAANCRVEQFVRAKALNTSSAFIGALADLVQDALSSDDHRGAHG